MARFWKPRNLPAVKWNPAKEMPFFEFSPEGFFDTTDKKLIEYMQKCGYRLLSPAEVEASEKFIAERLKERGEDTSGFVEPTIPMDESENNPEDFMPIDTDVEVPPEDAPDAPGAIPDIKPVTGGNAESPLPDLELDEEGVEYEDEADATQAEETSEPQAEKTVRKVRRRSKASKTAKK